MVLLAGGDVSANAGLVEVLEIGLGQVVAVGRDLLRLVTVGGLDRFDQRDELVAVGGLVPYVARRLQERGAKTVEGA